MTASLRLSPGADRRQTYVVSFDVLLLDISQFTTGLEVGENGSAFVLTEDGRVIGLPRNERFADAASIKASVLRKVDALDLEIVSKLIREWKEDGARVVSFRGQGGVWRGGIESYALPGLKLVVGVVVPESDFLGDIRLRALIVLLVTLLALVAAIFLARALARRFSEPLEALAADSRRITNLDLRPTERSGWEITEFRQLGEAHDQMLAALRSFSRYVPTDVVRELMQRGEVARLGGRVEHLTVLFSDIEDFTGIAERMTPDRLAVHLSEYFDCLLEILLEHNATVDKFIGDSIMAFWGAPQSNPDHATAAVDSMLACRERLRDLNARWEKNGVAALPTRFGLATGELVVGNFGAEQRLAYTVFGDTVNLASRLQVLNRTYGTEVLVSGACRSAAGEGYAWRLVDTVAVKGKNEPVDVYELLGREDDVSETDKRDAATYEAALHLSRAGELEAAQKILSSISDGSRFEVSVRRLGDLCIEERRPQT